MIIWTRGYRPFILGGDVHGPVGVEIAEPGEKHELGKGYDCYVITSPLTGKTYVAEAETGAIVGSLLVGVRDDVTAADSKVMKKQIEEAREQKKHVTVLEADKFWVLMRRGA